VAATKTKPVLKHLKEHYTSATYPTDVGSIDILSKADRIAARIFVKNGEAYAIEVSNFPLEIIRRIITSEHVSERMRDEILSKYGKDLTNPSVVEYCLQNNIAPEESLNEYCKDLFLGACDYVALLNEATFKWNPNVHPTKLTAPPIRLDKLWRIVEARQSEMERIADVFNIGVEKIRELDFKKTQHSPPPSTQDEANIYSLASGEWSILDFARQFGMSLFMATHEMEKLWLKQGIEFIYDSEFKIKPTTQQVEQSHSQNEKQTKPLVSEELIKEPTTQPTVAVPQKNIKNEIEKLKEEISYMQIKLEEIKNRLEGLNE
jgi:hypothetical protein